MRIPRPLKLLGGRICRRKRSTPLLRQPGKGISLRSGLCDAEVQDPDLRWLVPMILDQENVRRLDVPGG